MKKVKIQRRKKTYFILIIILLGFFIYKMTYYWPKIYTNYQNINEYEQRYTALLEEEDTLKRNISKLKDPDYIARFAREKYLYSKDGEIIIKIVD